MTPREERRRRTQSRESEEPDELRNPIPVPLLIFSVLLMMWGVWYYFANAGFPLAAGDRRTPIEVPTLADVDGAQVYSANCASCHQTNGEGLAGVFPPLAQSRWVTGSADRLVQIMLYGIQGPLEVRGTVYNGVMPAFARLSDAELAAVTTYIRETWGNAGSPIGVDDIETGRERFPDRVAPWAGGEELDSVFGGDAAP